MKTADMNTKNIIVSLIAVMLTMGLAAQENRSKVKVVDANEKSVIVYGAMPSSSLSCQVGDFPAFRNASLTTVDFRDLQKIIVRHDLPARMDTSYVSVEMVTRDGESEVYEMSKSTRILGDTDEGSFSVKVKDLKSLEIEQ